MAVSEQQLCAWSSAGIERRRVLAWLESAEQYPVRILCAAIGAGKTFAIRQFVRRAGRAAHYLRVTPNLDAARLRALIAASPARAAVVLDDVDRMQPAEYASIVDDITNGELERKLILVGRSRRRLRVESLVAPGYAELCPQERLSFDAEEIERLAAERRVRAENDDLVQLLHDTDGWPLAVEWVVRDAAQNGGSLNDAFAQWRLGNAHLMLEFLRREAADESGALESLLAGFAGGATPSENEVAQLEQAGFPVIRTRGGLRPCRALTRVGTSARQTAPLREATLPPQMSIYLFGRFRCEIAGKPVTFSRRRDEQVFAFVVVQPAARASRAKLLDAFWPGVAHALAAQGLRTTLSRIRRALAECAPAVDPQLYFETTGEIRLNTATVAVDALRFLDHAEEGRVDGARGATDAAKHHYAIAQRLYVDRLLAAENPEPCFAAHAERFEAIYLDVLARIAELHAASGDFEKARESARALFSSNNEDARLRAIRCISIGPAGATA